MVVPMNGMQSALERNAADAARPRSQLIYFFTAGEDEVKCWQIRKGCKAPQARSAQDSLTVNCHRWLPLNCN
jgi:ribosome-binding ATPase YchF (GTP1/OBG family)